MFTGIIQGLGETLERRLNGHEARFRFRALFEHSAWVDGESIAINGVCLSIEKHDQSTFTAYASTETLNHTNLDKLQVGSKVNLERALAFGERLGGHLVSGHVDCVAKISEISLAGQSRKIHVDFPPSFSDQVISRGSITLDGISLTVTECGTGFLTVNLIPDSQKRTNASTWQKGTFLNMETDLIGKYVCNYLSIHSTNSHKEINQSQLDKTFLARNGFI